MAQDISRLGHAVTHQMTAGKAAQLRRSDEKLGSCRLLCVAGPAGGMIGYSLSETLKQRS